MGGRVFLFTRFLVIESKRGWWGGALSGWRFGRFTCNI